MKLVSGRARVSVAVAFGVFGAVFGAWATRVPAIKHSLDLSDGRLSIALFGMAIGFVAGTRAGPAIITRWSSRVATRSSVLALCAALIAPAIAWSLGSLVVALVLLGAAGGVCDIAMNAHAVTVQRLYDRPIMSSLHGLFSIGGMAGGATGALAAQAGISLLVHLTLAALVLGLVGIVGTKHLLVRSEPVALEHRRPHERGALWSPPVLLLGLIGFASFVGEGTAGDWSAVYLRDSLHAQPGVAAAAFTAFSGAMATARFVSDRLVARWGPVRVARTGSLVAACGLGAALGIPHQVAGVAGFALLGAGLAPVVPLAFSAAGNTGLGLDETVLGRVVTMSYLGSIAGPIMIGGLAAWIGLRAALIVPVALGLVIALIAGVVGPRSVRSRGARSPRTSL